MFHTVLRLHDGGFAEGVAAILRGMEDDQIARISIEIAEAAMMTDPPRTSEMLRTLGGLGINISVDDFGTGYSSVLFLKQVAAAELKIDKSFVVGMSENDENAVIVRSIIELAHNIGLEVVAEGVEDKQSYDILTAWGCDAVQGYYIRQALDPEELVLWLRQTSWGFRPERGKVATD